MKKVKLLFTMLIGMGITFLQGSFAFASSEEMIEKQREIDQYLFEDHVSELEEMGIHVTHTSPQEDYVEIGISPFSEEHANYLIEIFGEDVVKVVEGQQAVTFGGAPSTETAAGEEISSTSESNETTGLWLPIIGGLVLISGAIFIIRLRKQAA